MSPQFHKGDRVEVIKQSTGVDAITYFPATVLASPSKRKRKIPIEYKPSVSGPDSGKPSKETVDFACLRPAPPEQGDECFRLGDGVDVFCDNGWRKGSVKELLDNSMYVVGFDGNSVGVVAEQRNLRLHREWDDGEWIPALVQSMSASVCGSSTANNFSETPSKDPGWKYVTIVKPNNKNDLKCNFCAKINRGGIFRAKQHIVGGFRNATDCPNVPANVRLEIEAYMSKKVASNGIDTLSIPEYDDIETLGDDEDDGDLTFDVCSQQASRRGSKLPQLKRPKVNDPLHLCYTPSAGKVVRNRKDVELKLTPVNDACKEEMRERACVEIARWMYDASIPFSAVKYPSFAVMIDAIGQYGCGLKPPSYHEVRGPFLKKALSDVNELLDVYKVEWAKYGCSIMADSWTDKKDRTLINFLVNSPGGTVFLESVDVSSEAETDDTVYQFFDRIVEKVGEDNVIQFITASATYNVEAGDLLMEKRPNLYWTPCTAHCIDLILEDIGKMSKVKQTLKKAMSLNSYIYVRPGLAKMLRDFTGKKELVRPGITRFATAFLTLQRLHQLKADLRSMFTSEKWVKSKWAKEDIGKRICEKVVLLAEFWKDVVYILKVFGPLVKVLRMVTSEKRPPMGYIYEAMARAKEAIAKSFNDNEKKYKKLFKLIDKRWDIQIHRPLHAAAYYLNPAYFYKHELHKNAEVLEGLFQTIDRLVKSEKEKELIIDQLPIYVNAQGLFGIKFAVNQREEKFPAEWWELYGSSTPNLSRFATRVLNLTCSSFGCERNWSIFEQLHSERNKLDQKKLCDSVFVKYNRALQLRHEARDRIDPISLQDVDDANEWLMSGLDSDESDNEEEKVFSNGDLTGVGVDGVSGVEESRYPTRRGRKRATNASNSKEKGKAPMVVDEEDSEFEDDDEYLDEDRNENENNESYGDDGDDDGGGGGDDLGDSD